MDSKNLLSLIGNTPMVGLKRLTPFPKVEILLKLEFFNPGGSIKDRVALAMIEAAEQSGELTSQKTVIEATSGNTGIGLAMVCAVKGYSLMLIMPESASEERKRIMSAYGATIYLTPGHMSTDGAIEEAYRLAREYPERYVLMDQFNNTASIHAHYSGTAQEIWEQTKGQVTHVVVALGTSGTAMGLSKRLKEYNPDIQVVAVEPYVGHKIQGLKNMQASYPPGIYNKYLLDRILHVEDEEAFALCRELARKEGLFVGMSSGAALGGGLQLVRELEQGTVVIIFPDGGERYLSTSLFVPPSEQGLSLSTLSSRSQEFLDVQRTPVFCFCPGPSPYKPSDLEAWRRIVFMDVLSRYLQSKNISCDAFVGVADMDDQALDIAHANRQDLSAFSDAFVCELQRIGQQLGLSDRVQFPRASDQEQGMLKICQRLLEKGRAYEKLRSVYYDVFRDPDYGQLAGFDLEKLSLGKTVDLEDYAKDNPRDFTLLKRASLQDLKNGEFIKTQWGNVRPSWYLQMAASLGDNVANLQVVMGGRTHRFPQLENLRALWAKANFKIPQIWMIVQAVRSKEDTRYVPDLFGLVGRMSSPFVLRMWLLSLSYQKPLFFSEENLKMWQHNWDRVQNLMANVQLAREGGQTVDSEVDQAVFDLKTGFTDMVEDDISLYRFWPVLFDFCKMINNRFQKGRLTSGEAALIIENMTKIDTVLRIIDWDKLPLMPGQWPQHVQEKIAERTRAKKNKDYSRADQLRQEIVCAGYQIEDTPFGPRLYLQKA
jgi:cysteinyl-tRNA synthetase